MRKAGWDPRLLHANTWHGAKGAVHRDGGYACHECGTTWKPSRRRAWWPISFQWFYPSLGGGWRFGRAHGIEVAAEGIEQRIFATVLHLGPLKVCFGLRRTYDFTGATDCAICRPCVSPEKAKRNSPSPTSRY